MSTVTTKDGTQIYYKDWRKGPSCLHEHSAFFRASCRFHCPERFRAAAPRLLRALLIGGDPKADDQSYDHGPSSATQSSSL